ncbi:hypothetical protein A1O3_05417 [Capronia epimyces CBS 606.96]|uniref:Aminotransferase n=1 Tax=Capronia epimyces CBS 606.96 TaxID=1182542 RepID=W9Y520_9EURO|nr:uncharacterized protein A1O3_05417 [Capronia epimyces CBS 606.96]EXJ84745.1 hypothetical protein A1O3_05417 [Capronia epimyces CBS 606.96]
MTSKIFHRSLTASYPSAIGGQGCYVVTGDGRQILDGSSGAAVSCLGHGNPEVTDAIVAQAQAMSFAHTSFFTSDPAEELAKVMMEKSDGAFCRMMLLCSGSEAVESALKLARQYHVYRGQPQRIKIIGRMHSYHGNTLGALAAGNNPPRRKTYAPILSPSFHHVSRCFHAADGPDLEEQVYEDQLIAEFEAKFHELGPETIAAVIVEPVVGATLGSVPATSTYLPRLKELCHRHGALIIFDEVMCGMGRVGTYHAWQHEKLGGVAPDLQTIGKGLGAGYQPISAVLIGQGVYDTFQAGADGAQAFLSGHTYQGHAIGCAAALAVARIVHRDQLLANVVRMGDLLETTLRQQLPPIFTERGGSIRGLGLFRTVDFGHLGDAFGAKAPLAAQVAAETLAQGAAVYTCSVAVDAILFAPPYIITRAEILTLVRAFLRALDVVLQQRGSGNSNGIGNAIGDGIQPLVESNGIGDGIGDGMQPLIERL